jgi:hypothetical protein
VRFIWVDRDEFDRRFVDPLPPAAVDRRNRIRPGSS